MKTCGAQWQVRARFGGLVKVYVWALPVAACTLDSNHEGKHYARVRSNINNEVATLEW